MARPSVAPSNQWPERAPKRISAVAVGAYFEEQADGVLEVTEDVDEATHSLVEVADGAWEIAAFVAASRMVLIGGDLVPIAVPLE